MTFCLRDYQVKAIDDLRKSIGGGRRSPLLVAPTGSGKTAIASEMIQSAIDKGKQVLFLAPRRELVYQVCNRLDQMEIKYGVIMAGEERLLSPDVQVASISTLHARAVQRDKIMMPKADLVMVDEAHIGVGGAAQAIIDEYKNSGAVVIGLTATPARMDGLGLGEIYDDMIQAPTTAELIDQRHLVPARYFAGSKPDVEGVKIQVGDYQKKQLAERSDQPVLVGDIVTNWLRLAKDRQTFVFSVNVAHSRHLCEEFQRYGIAAAHVDGNTEIEERKEVYRKLQSGELQVVTNCMVYTYGVDFPPVSCIVVACPTKSITKYFQMVGRGLRTSEGKQDCFVLDHAGVIDEIGFIDDPMPWSLNSKRKIQERRDSQEKKEPKPIECPECKTQFRAAKYCPNCGHEMGSKYTKAIEALDAELREIDKRKRFKESKGWTQNDKAQFFAELKGYAKKHGYKTGWAVHKYKEKLGVLPWPVYDTPMREPGDITLSWIRSRQIAWAKSNKSNTTPIRERADNEIGG